MTTIFGVRFNLMQAFGILNSRSGTALKLGPSSLIQFIVRILVFYDTLSDTNSSTLTFYEGYWPIEANFNYLVAKRSKKIPAIRHE